MGYAALVVEDETVFAKNIQTYLTRDGNEVRIAGDATTALSSFVQSPPSIVILDYDLPGANGLELLAQLKARDASVPVLMLTGRGGVRVAVDAMKAGAVDYLSKPLALSELKQVIQRVLAQQPQACMQVAIPKRVESSADIGTIVGQSAPIGELRTKLAQIVAAERQLNDHDAPAVLIVGETGTGKELVARSLHFSGMRAAKPFVEINCASIPSNLLEAELFGYERGAFTDAKERKMGLVEAADGGTLFLDEIGEVELATQAKLLKLLEEKRLRRLGGIREQQVNIRIVAATNRQLDEMVREGKFRADLYYRLRIIQVTVPPLRNRREDILILANHFLRAQAQRYGRTNLRLTADAERRLTAHRWPGNVRELRNAIEQAILLAPDHEISAEQFPFCDEFEGADALNAPLTCGLPAEQALGGNTVLDSELLDVDATERRLILTGLRQAGGNVTRAAKLLGLSRDTLRYRIERHGIKSGAF